MRCFIFLFYLIVQECCALIEMKNDVSYQIAGIFEEEKVTQRLAFDDSMKDASVDDYRLDPIFVQQSRRDVFSSWRDLCTSQSMQPIVIFGPQTSSMNAAVLDQCSILKIPHLQASWQPQELDFTFENDTVIVENNSEAKEEQDESAIAFKKITINFFPNTDEISIAYASLLGYYRWENFAALYEDENGLMRIQKMLAEYTDQYPVTIRKLELDGDNYKVFKELQNSQESRFFIDCHVENVLKYMDIINMLNLDDFYQHYIFSSMDTSIVAHKLTDFRSNITWLSVTEYDKLIDAQHFLAQRVERWTINTVSPPVTDMPIEALLMNDVANHVMKAVTTLEKNTTLQKPPTFSCESEAEAWEYGALLQQEILKTQTTGVSGNIEFDEMGRRKNYVLYVNEIHLKKRQTIGKWESSSGGNIIEDRPDADNIVNQQTRKHFYVISRKAKPYFYEKEKCTSTDCEEDDGEEYEGFSVDLVKQIFEILKKENFNYTYSFKHDTDYIYGHYDKDKKKWNGLIGDLLDKKADLAVCDLTITEERKKVVDFSVPFMSLGISILYVQEKKVDPGMFSFLNPYTFEVWMYIATAYCVVSIVLFVCSRISPADWENPQPCDKDPEELENKWNFKNCVWLTMGSIMTQGCDILPKAIGTRWVCAMWWFFAVIVCQTYIAQLSASMTSALENEPINSVEDLATQNKILYGALDGGSTFSFFKNSMDKMYQRMYDNMIANSVVLVKSNDEGEKRVINGKGKYAFFMESVTIEYKLKRNCELKKVGGELDSKDYGIAMPANSPFRTDINRAILKLKESNALDKIKRKWWENKYGAISCNQEEDKNDVEGDLEMKNLIGAFVVLIVGIVLALFITAAEFMNEVRNIVVREGVTHKEVFIKELKASLNFFQLQKPVLRNLSRAPFVASSLQSITKGEKEKRPNEINAFLEQEKNPQ